MIKYQTSFKTFYASYADNPISPYNNNLEWKNSLDKIAVVISNADILITQNENNKAHLDLEKVRQEWQRTFTRNNVTMLGFYLTEFHDIMEKAIDESGKKDFVKLEVICNDMNNAWTEVVNIQTEFSSNQDYADKITAETNTLNKFCEDRKSTRLNSSH